MAKEKNQNKKELNIKIEGVEWTTALDSAFKEKVKTVTVDGFRKGKCPRDIFEKKYGKESLYMDAAEKLLGTAYEKVMDENKDIVPVVQPRVDIKSIDDTGVEFTFTIITAPTVTVKKYKGLKVSKDEVEVTKEEIEHELSHLLEKYTELVVKENGTVENGDVAIIDFEGFKDGVAFEGGKGENYSLEIGSNTFIPGFEEQLVGMKTGEEKEINVTFPEDYAASDLAGCEVIFKVKVNEIKVKEVRELDKDFIDDLGMEGIDSKEKLEKEIETNIKANKDMDAENKYIDDLLEAASKNMTIDLDEEIVDAEVERMYKEFTNRLKMQGIDEELYFAYAKVTKEKVKEDMKKEAETRVKYRYLLEAIVKAEKIEISEKDAKAELKKMAEDYKMTEEDLLKEFNNSLEVLKYDLAMRKAIEVLKENN